MGKCCFMGSKIIYFCVFCGGLLFFSSVLWAYSGVSSIEPRLLMGQSGKQYPRSERAIDNFQESFIYNVLTKQLFKTSSLFEEDKEDEEMLFSNQQSEQFINELLAREIAKDLARKDVLKLRTQLNRQIGM